jgi:protein-S-isoprenylcysteine O-methyltransferase Ste14
LTASDQGHALWWDTGLSLAFFAVHSGLVRRSFRRWSARFVPEEFAGAVYAIASGAVLLAALVFWRSGRPLYEPPPGAVRWPVRGVFLLALLVFLWAGLSLKGFDPCGLRPILDRLKDRVPRRIPFSARGAYRWVRHPLYATMIVMAWSCPDLTVDRLLFDVLWTGWMVAATRLEERDLVAQFGREYRDYQRMVPMLVPRARPVACERGASDGRALGARPRPAALPSAGDGGRRGRPTRRVRSCAREWPSARGPRSAWPRPRRRRGAGRS